MSPPPATPHGWGRGRRQLLLAVAAVGVACVAAWWATGRHPGGGQSMAGTWRVRLDGSPADLPIEYEFRPGGSCVVRHLDPETGAVTRSFGGQEWRRDGDTLVVHHPGETTGPWWDPFSQEPDGKVVYALTPDGPDRFRYTRVVHIGPGPGGQPASGTLTRSGPSP